MAARTRRPNHNDKSREAIRTSQLVNRLQDHIFDPEGKPKVEISSTQLKAIEILLKKSLPDLSAIDHTGEIDQKHFVITSPPTSPENNWLEEHGKNDKGNTQE